MGLTSTKAVGEADSRFATQDRGGNAGCRTPRAQSPAYAISTLASFPWVGEGNAVSSPTISSSGALSVFFGAGFHYAASRGAVLGCR
jgi:hypothetical protein